MWQVYQWLLGKFPCRFLKRYFPFCILSSSLAAFSFTLKMLFLPLTSFTVCHANRDCLSSAVFLILLIWPGMYYYLSFWCSSLWAFLSFCTLAFVGFLLLHKDAFFMLSHFFLINSDSLRISHLPLGLVDTLSTDASMWAAMKFPYFWYLLKSIEFVSYSYRIFIANISISKWGTNHNLWFWLFVSIVYGNQECFRISVHTNW